MTAAAFCPGCSRRVQPVRPGPPPYCVECDPQPGVAKLRETREKDRAEAYRHSMHKPTKKGARR